MKVKRDWSKREIVLDHYCEEILERFHFLLYDTVRQSPLPADASKLLAITDTDNLIEEQLEFRDSFPYRQVAGALLYLVMYTRPNIAYAVGVLARFGAAPTYNACYCTVHLLQYLSGDRECKVVLRGEKFELHGFSDVDWAGDILSRKSTTGYVLFAIGVPIAWQSEL